MDFTIVIPVYNEEYQLKNKILKLAEYLRTSFKSSRYEIVIADNASTDRTSMIGKAVSREIKAVKYLHIPRKGRGIALKTAWRSSKADLLCYMDVDLATDLSSFKEMIIETKEFDIIIGSRFLNGSRVERSIFRSVLSSGYNAIIRFLFQTRLRDMQCGFKCIRKKTFEELLPQLRDNEFFFDTEMLLIAEKLGYKIKEIPIKWVEGKTTTVKIKKTVIDYLKNSFELKKRLNCLSNPVPSREKYHEVAKKHC
jgi:glycosyltransferase involved in cell wall biosynthesis